MNFIEKAREAFSKPKAKLMAAAPTEARLRIEASIEKLKAMLEKK